MPIYKRCPRCHKRILEGTTCPCLVQYRKAQKKERNKDYDRYRRNKKNAEFYHSRAWRMTSDTVRAKYMYIDVYAFCKTGHVIPSDMVHHIVPISQDWNKRLDVSDLIPLSNKSHAEIHARMKKEDENLVKRELRVCLKEFEKKWIANRVGDM